MYRKIGIFFIFVTVCTVFAEDSDKDLINMINEIDNEKSLYLFGGLSIEKSEIGRSASSLASTNTILDRAEKYINEHNLKFTLTTEDDDKEIGRSHSNQESRTRKLKKIILPLLLALKLKLAIILPILFLIIKAISLKGLAAGLLALIFSGAALFKDLLSKKQEHITTAYITGSPLNAEIVHSDWNRNGQVAAASAQELAYNYHTIPQPAY